MIITYQMGDQVFRKPYIGGHSWEIIGISSRGLALSCDATGETAIARLHEVEPHPGTIGSATLRSEKSS